MEDFMANVGWQSALIAAFSSLAVGFIWYHEKVFGHTWMTSLGKSKEDLSKGNMAVIFGLTFLLSFVLAYFLQLNIELSHAHPNFDDPSVMDHSFHTFKHGAFHGVFFCLLFIMPVLVIKALFERFSWKYMLIHIGYWMVTLAIMGGIVDQW